MKYVRILLFALLAASIAAFGAAKVKEFSGRNEHVPEISCESGTLELSCSYTEEELFSGVSAYDEEDGNLTDKILVGSFSRFVEQGTCTATYVVFDSANAAATCTRRVHFTDYESPKIRLIEPLVFTEGSGSTDAVRSRLLIADKLDGDLSGTARFSNISTYYDYAGNYSLTVTASNSFGDTVSETLPVHIIDKRLTGLVISLTEPLIYLPVGAAFDPLSYVAGVADLSGNEYSAEDHVTFESDVDTAVPGVYEVYCTAENEGGAAGVTWLTVIVEE